MHMHSHMQTGWTWSQALTAAVYLGILVACVLLWVALGSVVVQTLSGLPSLE